jgi:hypothetical protein
MRFAPRLLSTSSRVLFGLAFGVIGGCGPTPAPAPAAGTPSSAASSEKQVAADALLDSAVQLLQASKRSPAAHVLAAQRLNQYLTKTRTGGQTSIGPLNTDLKTSLVGRLSAPQIQLIESEQFDRPDSIHLEGCFLLHDAAKQIVEGKRDKQSKALAVLDWVVRNVQIVRPEDSAPVPLGPPMTILVGRGNEAERAWTFMELLRQSEVESVMLATMEKSSDGKQTVLTPWIPAAVWDGEMYLFDTTLGLPVPGPGEQPVATWKQVAAEPELLQRLSPDPQHPYRIRPEQLQHLAVLLESTPMYWAPRMRFLQDSLTGDKRATLWSDLVALSEEVRRAAGDEMPQDLWVLPKTVHELNFTKEYTEKILGNRENPIGVLAIYQYFSCSEARTLQLQRKWPEAIPLYLANRIHIDQWMADNRNQVAMRNMVANALGADTGRPEVAREIAAKVATRVGDLYNSVREDSTYFLGTAKFEQQDYRAATSWMAKSYLEKYPDGRWASGARYHLARCAEAQNDTAKAIEYYTMSDNSPQADGNRVRARRLGWVGYREENPDTGVSAEPPQSDQ